MSRRYLHKVAAVCAMTGLFAAVAAQAVTTLPPGFAQTAVFTGHTKPVSVRFAPNGQISWEEVNRVGDVLGDVENFGWPCYEGDNTGSAIESSYDQQNLCLDLYADNIPPGILTTAPYFAYHHDDKVVEGEECGTGASAVAGIAFYSGANYPSTYSEALAFADSSRRCIWTMFTPSGVTRSRPTTWRVVSNAPGRVVDLQMAPDGNLYYVEYQLANAGKAWRLYQ